MKIFTPNQLNHQDIDSGFVTHEATDSSRSFSSLQSLGQSDSLIIIILVLLLLLDIPSSQSSTT